ncbi:hypothetical protein E4O77_04685 [Neisseria meningitidis]|nr:hypothetical protein [Neisseria meningitidis]MBG8720951.1 hypothetical protein [Neisseria meningitidis]
MWVRRIMVGKNKKEAYFNGNLAAPPHIFPAKPYRIPHRCGRILHIPAIRIKIFAFPTLS